MTSNLQKSQQNYEEIEGKENKSDGSDSSDSNSSLKLFRREFHNSLDLNRSMVDSTLIKFDEPCKLLIKSENSVGNQIKGGSGLKQETKKRDLTDLETIDHQQDTNYMDLELKLSPPKVIISKGESSKSSSTIFSQENYASSSSTNSSNYEDICGSDCKVKALPSVILMGCTHCYLYAMVSEAEPECPKCKTSILLDIFRENPSKKCKKT